MSFEVVRDVDGLSDREINDLLLVDDTPDHRTSVSRTKSVISGLGGTSMNSANSSLGDDAKWRFQGVSQRRAWKMRIRIASHPVPLATRALASLLAVTVAISWVVTSGLFAADDPPRFDRGKTKEAVRAILAKHVGQVRTGLWMGGQLGDALYEKGSGETLPTASAIKTAILIELFARFAEALDQPPPGLDAILKDDHPAIAHFNAQQRGEIRKGLSAVPVRRLGGIMMGSVPASNLVYNAAANVSTALLGGPREATRMIRARDPAFAPIAVRRNMLADRKATGDNEATLAALAAVLQRLSSRHIPGIADATVEDIRRAILTKDDPRQGRIFLKDGDLASDPITCVRTGWCEKPGVGAFVFVVMLVRDDPGAATRDETHRELAATAGRLVEILLDHARNAAR